MVKLVPYKNAYIMPEWKCYTIWFIEGYKVIKGKTLKKADIDLTLTLMCLELRKKLEEIDSETVYIKEETEEE